MDLPHRAISVYIYLADRANKDGICWPSIPTISKDLKEHREKISSQLRNNIAAKEHVRAIVAALDQEDHRITQWDEEMIRQLVHTVKVISTDHIRVYLNDGTEIDQTVGP